MCQCPERSSHRSHGGRRAIGTFDFVRLQLLSATRADSASQRMERVRRRVERGLKLSRKSGGRRGPPRGIAPISQPALRPHQLQEADARFIVNDQFESGLELPCSPGRLRFRAAKAGADQPAIGQDDQRGLKVQVRAEVGLKPGLDRFVRQQLRIDGRMPCLGKDAAGRCRASIGWCHLGAEPQAKAGNHP